MTWITKIKIMTTVTIVMGFGFFMMMRRDLYIPCAILGCVWLLHLLYFVFGVKKYVPRSGSKDAAEEDKDPYRTDEKEKR